jgi:transcriptional regulator with XRE-family HTH domain
METIMDLISTPHELEISLGENIKTLRLQKNLDRKTLCAQAGISENALRHLEGGKGATIKTLIRVVKALERESWLTSIAPQVSINPLHLVRDKFRRQRASRRIYDKKEKI